MVSSAGILSSARIVEFWDRAGPRKVRSLERALHPLTATAVLSEVRRTEREALRPTSARHTSSLIFSPAFRLFTCAVSLSNPTPEDTRSEAKSNLYSTGAGCLHITCLTKERYALAHARAARSDRTCHDKLVTAVPTH